MSVKSFLVLVATFTITCLAGIITCNYVVDIQNVFTSKKEDIYERYAALALESKYGIYSPPVDGTILKYAMMKIGKPDCALYGSSHIGPAAQKEMPSIFGDCKNFLNVWVTGGGTISGTVFAHLAVKQRVKRFVYEVSPHWYNFDNTQHWLDRPYLAKEGIAWANAGSNETAFNRLQFQLDLLLIKFEALINAEYFKRNFTYIYNSKGVLPNRDAKLENISVKHVSSLKFRDSEQTLLRPDGSITFSDIHVNRPSNVNRCKFPGDVKWAWDSLEGTLKKLTDAGIDTRIMLIPAHQMILDGCPTYRQETLKFYNRLQGIAKKLGITIHGSFFPEDLGDPNKVSENIMFDGHHINVREWFHYMK